jgi:DNA-binding MarR family transcriptional regulator
MSQHSKAAAIRAALAAGPATTSDLSAQLGWPGPYVAAQLSVMCRRGTIRRADYIGPDNRRRCLWSLGRRSS